MTDESSVIMGVSFSEDLGATDEGGNLVFSGAALEAGVWTDAHGNTAYFPTEVIQQAAELFNGVDILCEHQGIPIGKVLETEVTDKGFRVKKGIITSRRMASRVLENKLRGLSIRAVTRLDPVRKVVMEIFGAQEVSLVKNPACKVCMLDDYRLEADPMTSGIKSDVDVDVEVDVKQSEQALKEYEQYPEPDCEKFKDSPEIYKACNKFAKAVETFQKAQAEWHSMFADKKEYLEEPAKMGATEEEIEIVEEETEAEVEIEASTAEEEVEEEEIETEEEVEVEVAASGEVEELKTKIENLDIALAEARAEVSVLRAQVAAQDAAVRKELEEAVLSADPNADKELIGEMSDRALEKYLDTVMRLSKPTVGGTKKSVKKDEKKVEETVETEVTPKALTSAGIIDFLKMKQ